MAQQPNPGRFVSGNDVLFHVNTTKGGPPHAPEGGPLRIIFVFKRQVPGLPGHPWYPARQRPPQNYLNSIMPSTHFNAQIAAIRQWVYAWENDATDVLKQRNGNILAVRPGHIPTPRKPSEVLRTQTDRRVYNPFLPNNGNPCNDVWVTAPYHESDPTEAAHITITVDSDLQATLTPGSNRPRAFYGDFHIYMDGVAGFYQGYRYTDSTRRPYNFPPHRMRWFNEATDARNARRYPEVLPAPANPTGPPNPPVGPPPPKPPPPGQPPAGCLTIAPAPQPARQSLTPAAFWRQLGKKGIKPKIAEYGMLGAALACVPVAIIHLGLVGGTRLTTYSGDNEVLIQETLDIEALYYAVMVSMASLFGFWNLLAHLGWTDRRDDIIEPPPTPMRY